MEKSNFTDEQIDDYIMGLFDEKARKSFEADLSANSELSQRLEERKALIVGVEAYHAQVFKDKLKTIHEKAFNETPAKSEAKRRSLVPWLIAAASIAILVIAFFLMKGEALNADQLYADNFRIHKLELTQRNKTDQQKVELENLYEAGNYAAAVPIFDDLLSQESRNSALLLGAGIAKMENGNPEAAIEHFDNILANGDILYKDHALWYKALALIKDNKIDEARQVLKSLTAERGADHYQEGTDLLDDLEGF